MEVLRCPICGKEFIPAPENIYKVIMGARTEHFCSWGCYRIVQKQREAEKKARKEVR